MKKRFKQISALCLTLVLIFTAGCSSNGENATSNSESTSTSSQATDTPNNTSQTVTIGDPENDTQVGLKNIKLDTKDRELTESEKAIITYFDNDYLMAYNYEFLRRYPNLFQDAQISVYGMVAKVISMDNESYKIVLWINTDPSMVDYATPGEYIVLNGKTNSSWLMENDLILATGRYTGVETIDIDGTSYTIPVMDVFNTYYNSTRMQFTMAEKFDYPFIKTVAEAIFGSNIEIREPVAGEDLSMETAMVQYYALGYSPYPDMDPSEITEYMDLLVELEDQSNANFQKFRFSKYEGSIIDAKGPFDSGIERRIEFSADFEHFFLFTHNEGLGSLKLAYYDKAFNKIWERDFSEISNAVYDYTETNLYIVVNNELYIINIETGEDVFDPSYVGEKKEIRKDTDGIVIVSAGQSDGVMKTSNNGEIVWKTNLSTDVDTVNGVQFVNGNVILDYTDPDWGQHYCLIDGKTGEMIIDAQG